MLSNRVRPADSPFLWCAALRHHEPPQVRCRILLSWKDVCHAEEDRSEDQGAVCAVLEHLSEFPSLTAAAASVARREGLGEETVRRWVVQAQIDGGQRRGATSELAEIRELKARVRGLEEDSEILRRASIFFAGSSTPAVADRRVRRRDAGRGSRGRVGLPGPARAGLSDRRADLPLLGARQPSGRGPHAQRRDGHRPGPGPGVDGGPRGCAQDDPRGVVRTPEDDRRRATYDAAGLARVDRPGDASP